MTTRDEELAEKAARDLHETYERLAPDFGYYTRPETRVFDSESAHGKLMIAVCGEVFERALRKQREEFEADTKRFHCPVGLPDGSEICSTSSCYECRTRHFLAWQARAEKAESSSGAVVRWAFELRRAINQASGYLVTGQIHAAEDALNVGALAPSAVESKIDQNYDDEMSRAIWADLGAPVESETVPVPRVERGDAVNLARSWLDSQGPRSCMHVATDGIRLLAEAVMNMDAALLAAEGKA